MTQPAASRATGEAVKELMALHAAMQSFGRALDKAGEACGPNVHYQSREYKAYMVALTAWEESEKAYNSKAVELVPALLAEIERLTAAAAQARRAALLEAADMARNWMHLAPAGKYNEGDLADAIAALSPAAWAPDTAAGGGA